MKFEVQKINLILKKPKKGINILICSKQVIGTQLVAHLKIKLWRLLSKVRNFEEHPCKM